MYFESPFCTALDLNIYAYYISLILPFMSFIFCTCMSRRLLSFGGQGLFSSVNFYTNVYFYHLFFIKYYTFNSGYLKKKFQPFNIYCYIESFIPWSHQKFCTAQLCIWFPLWVPRLYWIYFVSSNIMIFFMVLKPILPNFWIHLYWIL